MIDLAWEIPKISRQGVSLTQVRWTADLAPVQRCAVPVPAWWRSSETVQVPENVHQIKDPEDYRSQAAPDLDGRLTFLEPFGWGETPTPYQEGE